MIRTRQSGLDSVALTETVSSGQPVPLQVAEMTCTPSSSGSFISSPNTGVVISSQPSRQVISDGRSLIARWVAISNQERGGKSIVDGCYLDFDDKLMLGERGVFKG